MQRSVADALDLGFGLVCVAMNDRTDRGAVPEHRHEASRHREKGQGMSASPAYQRMVLKLSGELLKGASSGGIAPDAVMAVATRVKQEVADLGVQLALVIGAGNVFRGEQASRMGMTRTAADKMGMLATVMNALAMRDALEAQGARVVIQSAIPMTGIVDPFDGRRALAALDAGRIVIFAGGTGHPYFTTDTTAALRACEIGAHAILKGTKVDGVYTADPTTCAEARRFSRISYADALGKRLRLMDATAFSLCMDNHIPIIVFSFAEPGSLRRIVAGDMSRATVVHDGDTVLDAESNEGEACCCRHAAADANT